MANNSIVTGDYVTLQQTPASLADRIVARLIDFAIQAAYAGLSLLILSQLNSLLSDNERVVYYVCVFMLPTILYHPLMEIFHHGQSVGKQVMGIRVVQEDGTTPTVSSYLLRFILSPVEIELTGLAVLPILFSRKHQRLGDMAAGTIVVKARTPLVALPSYDYTMPGYEPTYAEAADLSTVQAQVVTRVLNNSRPDREHLIAQLAIKMQMMMQLVPTQGIQEQFLTTVLNDYYYYCSTVEV